jgi:hypothetical protein
MKRSIIIFCLALAAGPAPVFAQQTAPPDGPPPAFASPNPQMIAAMRQSRVQMQQLRQQVRSRMLASLTPAHRTAFANLVSQLALSVEPNPRAAATQLDAILAPAEKQSVLTLAAAERTSMEAIMQQTRAAVEATLSADQRARMAQREAKMEAFRSSHPRAAHAADPGMILLRTLASFGPEHGFGGPRGGAL